MSDSGERKPRRDDVVELVLERFGTKGGVEGSFAGHVVLVRHGPVGARVRARVLRRRGKRIEARVLETLDPGPDAAEPRCSHFGTCGGCSYQDLAYAAQLRELGDVLARALARPGLPPLAIDPVVGCDEPWAYRNKMDFTFATRRWIGEDEPPNAPDGFALGLHVPGRFDKVMHVERCPIQLPGGDAILADVRRLALELDLPPWDLRTHTGLLRHLVLRRSWHTGEILVLLVTSAEATAAIDAWAERLAALHPGITTIVQGINTRPASIAVGERERVLFGPGTIRERLGGLDFAVSAGSFFQTNTPQAEKLVAIVAAEAALAVGERVLDLYCGAGALALNLAARAEHVEGYELVESAVADARRNAAANRVANATFVAGDLADTLRARDPAAPAPAVCVTDPPRAGMHPKVLGALAALAPQRIVYVSCNPRAAAGDLEALAQRGWRPVRVRPIDLFPHTPHLECVVRLERSESVPPAAGGG